MNIGVHLLLVGPCSWIPGSRSAPAPRNDGDGATPSEL